MNLTRVKTNLRAALVLSLIPVGAFADERSVLQRMKSADVELRLSLGEAGASGRCHGTIVGSHQIVTARHCLEFAGLERVEIRQGKFSSFAVSAQYLFEKRGFPELLRLSHLEPFQSSSSEEQSRIELEFNFLDLALLETKDPLPTEGVHFRDAAADENTKGGAKEKFTYLAFQKHAKGRRKASWSAPIVGSAVAETVFETLAAVGEGIIRTAHPLDKKALAIEQFRGFWRRIEKLKDRFLYGFDIGDQVCTGFSGGGLYSRRGSGDPELYGVLSGMEGDFHPTKTSSCIDQTSDRSLSSTIVVRTSPELIARFRRSPYLYTQFFKSE